MHYSAKFKNHIITFGLLFFGCTTVFAGVQESDLDKARSMASGAENIGRNVDTSIIPGYIEENAVPQTSYYNDPAALDNDGVTAYMTQITSTPNSALSDNDKVLNGVLNINQNTYIDKSNPIAGRISAEGTPLENFEEWGGFGQVKSEESRSILTCYTNSEGIEICPSNLACGDDSCSTGISTTEQDPNALGQGVATLQTASYTLGQMQGIQQNFIDQYGYNPNDPDFNGVFSGRHMQCRDDSWGAKNCCANSGWTSSLGLGSEDCSTEELTLGLAKQSNKVIDLNYREEICDGTKFLGDCLGVTRYKNHYCVYDHQIAKIMIRDGFPQIPKTIDTNCTGYTFAEMERLDFEKINLAELYEGAVDTANQQNMEQSPNDINQSLQQQLILGGGP